MADLFFEGAFNSLNLDEEDINVRTRDYLASHSEAQSFYEYCKTGGGDKSLKRAFDIVRSSPESIDYRTVLEYFASPFLDLDRKQVGCTAEAFAGLSGPFAGYYLQAVGGSVADLIDENDLFSIAFALNHPYSGGLSPVEVDSAHIQSVLGYCFLQDDASTRVIIVMRA